MSEANGGTTVSEPGPDTRSETRNGFPASPEPSPAPPPSPGPMSLDASFPPSCGLALEQARTAPATTHEASRRATSDRATLTRLESGGSSHHAQVERAQRELDGAIRRVARGVIEVLHEVTLRVDLGENVTDAHVLPPTD